MMAGRGVDLTAAGGPARHIPVMLTEVLAALAPKAGEIVVDGTLGAGGYTCAILEAACCMVIAIDRDPDAVASARALEKRFPGRLHVVLGRFADIESIAEDQGAQSHRWRDARPRRVVYAAGRARAGLLLHAGRPPRHAHGQRRSDRGRRGQSHARAGAGRDHRGAGRGETGAGHRARRGRAAGKSSRSSPRWSSQTSWRAWSATSMAR